MAMAGEVSCRGKRVRFLEARRHRFGSFACDRLQPIGAMRRASQVMVVSKVARLLRLKHLQYAHLGLTWV
jgi:hypothetical protein